MQTTTSMSDTHHTLVRGGIGMGSTFAGLIVSALPSVEAWLRITSLLFGISFGVMTLVKMWRRMKRETENDRIDRIERKQIRK